jgi:predicted PurR-regulated permease PerM
MSEKLPRAVLALSVTALLGIVLVLFEWGSEFLTPVLIALYTTALISPAYGWLLKRRFRPALAVLTMVLLILIVGVGLIGLALLSLNRLAAGISEYADAAVDSLTALQQQIEQLGGLNLQLSSNTVSKVLLTILEYIAQGLIALLTGVVLVAFFLLESRRFSELITSESMVKIPFLNALPQVATAAIRYFLVRFRVNLITGLTMSVVYLFLGVDYFALWGVLLVILSYIPYVGMVLALIPPVILALLESGPLTAIVLIIVAAIVNAIAENVLAPSMSAKSLSLSPTVVFVSFFFWGWLLGFAGMLLAMPLTVLIALILRGDPQTRWLAQFIGAVEPEPVQDESPAKGS